MKLLLDTHMAIWAVKNPERIDAETRRLISDPDHEIFVSAVTIWEIAIKYPLDKRHGAPPFSAAAGLTLFAEAGFAMLDITPAHAAAVENLPAHHADPFDRLIIAQALWEPMRLVTADAHVARYSDTIVLARA